MLKKAGTKKGEDALKAQYEKLGTRLNQNCDRIEAVMKTTSIPGYVAQPNQEVFKNLLPECEDCDFWLNFRKLAPILFCTAIEKHEALKQARDISFMEELLKTKAIFGMMKEKISAGATDIDIVEFSLANSILEHKLKLLESLNFSVDSEESKIKLNVAGTKKSIQIDIEKLKEAITFIDGEVDEKEMVPNEEAKTLESVDITDATTDEEFMEKAMELIGPLKKTKNKTLQKDSFIKVFKYCGEFAKMRSKEIKKQAQVNRCEHFEKDSKAYLKALTDTVTQEEGIFESSSQMMFDKLCITPECFERSQQEMMMDPMVSMELFQMGLNMEKPTGSAPSVLSRDKTIEIVKASNDYAFDLFKKEYIEQMKMDPMMIPVIISAIAHDWVFKKHGYPEEQFKAALFDHKIYEDEGVAMHMQQKQMELMAMSGGFNPMMMGGMPPMGGQGPDMSGGMGGMGGLPPMFGTPGGL